MRQRISKSLLTIGAIAGLLAFPVTAALAGGPDCGHRHNGACKADIEALCPDATTRPAKRQCLLDNQAKLSEACAAKIQAMQQRFEAVHAACADDLTLLCPSAQSPQEVRHCLRDHSDELSQGCSDALHSMRHGGKRR